MNHHDDQFDVLIDRAARQLVEHDPPQRLHVAVMSEVRGLGRRRRAPWLQWSLMASAGAVLIVALVLWNQPRRDVISDAPRSRVVAELPPPPIESPAVPPSSTPVRVRRERRPAAVSTAVVAEPEPLIRAIEVGQISIDSVRVAAIDAGPLAIPVIRVSNIDIDSP